MSLNQTARHWCITAFELEPVKLINEDDVRYLVYQIEKCPKTGKIHAQCYVEFPMARRMAHVKKLFGMSCHCEKRKGTAVQARDYCTKEDTRVDGPWEIGVFGGDQGKRSDLDAVAQAIKEKGLSGAIEEYPGQYIRYNKGMQALSRHLASNNIKAFRKVEVFVIYGPPGSGKTRSVYEENGFDDVYKLDKSNGNSVWFDGYNGEPVLLIDDFYGNIPYAQMLNLLDGYPLRLECKGSHAYAEWTKVYITSNVHPTEWGYREGAGCETALGRRISGIYELKGATPTRK